MDDIQEYAQMRREAESQHKRSVHQTTATTAGSASKSNGKASQSAAASSGGSSNGATASVNDTVAIVVDAVARQTRAEAIRERIGFDPTPRNS